MSLRLAIVVSISLVLLTSCASQKPGANKSELDYFIIGSGGGFTGMYEDFKVKANGEIFKMDFDSETYLAFRNVRKEDVSPFFQKLDSLKLYMIEYDRPGNMTYYLKIPVEGSEHIVRWGDQGQGLSPEVKSIHQEIQSYLKSISD